MELLDLPGPRAFWNAAPRCTTVCLSSRLPPSFLNLSSSWHLFP